MRTAKRFLPLAVILVIGVVHVCLAPREKSGCGTACSPKTLDLNGPVAAWLR